ncbi:BadF/BadG/BcrA/BcrD ATPase family protein [Pacificoceanicola onchidii]|uniref:BadF/BadG/BcrA/BcrD ATPase family protein n=1 Tax=Pacificoceanicola onchidii TaxID=2562685 RepID=UPI0010A486FE|nr:BadF/BadG/BcrA/BcrD ATPase family protein [Pacificoceanicola onchidii]
MTKTVLIGVDGGGTLCRAAARVGGTRFEVEGSGANASSHPDLCVTRLRAVLDSLAQEAGLTPDQRAAAQVYIGLAGVTGPQIAAQIRSGLGLPRAVIEEDRAAAVAGALGTEDGCLAALGTGSFLARQSDGAVRYQGGYGLRLGDEASGAWLGREMLSAALRAQDGFGPQSDLGHALLTRFGGPAGVITFGLEASPQALAELAPDITAAAGAGDALATTLLMRGAGYISDGLMALGWRVEPVVLTGGLGPRYAAWLPEPMQASLREPKGSALDGALMLAERRT